MNSILLFEALFIPLIIIFIGGTAKKLARGRGWKREDFFFGIELTLSAISGGLTLLFDSSIDADNSQKAGLFIAIAFGFFIYVLSLYQEYQNTTPEQEYIWLTFFSNTIGVGLMVILVFWVRR